jgi:hypothetical protein
MMEEQRKKEITVQVKVEVDTTELDEAIKKAKLLEKTLFAIAALPNKALED